MIHEPLTQVLVLLLASVLVVALARRLGLPPILGYLAVGLVVGPHALGFMAESDQTHLLAEIGVVFLLFTLGLEFSWPRMVAMRREVFGLGLLQMALTTARSAPSACCWACRGWSRVVVGGALSMASTAIVIRQLTEQAEINRTHGRLSLAILLFQDLAFVRCWRWRRDRRRRCGAATVAWRASCKTLGSGFIALLVVLLAGRGLLRPLFVEIAQQPAAGTVHADRAAGGAGIGLGHRARRAVTGAGRIPLRHDAGRDRVPAPGRSRDPAVPRAAAGPVLHFAGHAAGRDPAGAAFPAGLGHGAGAGDGQGRRRCHRGARCSSVRISRPCAPAWCWAAAGNSASRC